MSILLQVTAEAMKPECGATENPGLSNVAHIIKMEIQEKARRLVERL